MFNLRSKGRGFASAFLPGTPTQNLLNQSEIEHDATSDRGVSMSLTTSQRPRPFKHYLSADLGTLGPKKTRKPTEISKPHKTSPVGTTEGSQTQEVTVTGILWTNTRVVSYSGIIADVRYWNVMQQDERDALLRTFGNDLIASNCYSGGVRCRSQLTHTV